MEPALPRTYPNKLANIIGSSFTWPGDTHPRPCGSSHRIFEADFRNSYFKRSPE